MGRISPDRGPMTTLESGKYKYADQHKYIDDHRHHDDPIIHIDDDVKLSSDFLRHTSGFYLANWPITSS